jgi:ATP-dependent DNA helicase DinG
MTAHPLTRSVGRAFREGLPGIMAGAFEPRAQQAEMAMAVASVIAAGGVEVIEAETGLGKSLAYLIPLVLHCAREGSRAVVCTYTRHLQRQLVDKDYPLACRAAGVAVEGASLMGRGNYLCRRRAEAKAGERSLDAGTRRWLRDALRHETGEVDAMAGASRHLGAALRAAIVSPPRDAVCARCPLREDCFMLRARRRALDARVVVTNHALLFSNLALSGALLGSYDVLVVDEAHHLENVATDFFSLSYSPQSLSGGAQSVYTPELEETAGYIRAMVAAESEEDARGVDALWKAFHDALAEASARSADLFGVLGQNASRSLSGNASRSVRPGESGRDGFLPVQLIYEEGAPLMYGTEAAAADVSHALSRMEQAAGSMVEVAEGIAPVAESGAALSVRAIRDAAAETKAQFDFLASGSAGDHVFYARLDAPSSVSALAASPVDVSDRLGGMLQENSRAAVLTSATLAVGGDFSFILERLGLAGGGTVARRFDSPFDFDERRLVLLADYLPEPSQASFLPEAASLIEAAVAASGRRALVLCTAREQVAALGRLLAGSSAVGPELLLQADGASREDLLDRFRSSRRGVLAGLVSFWEGVDLPGEELELLVVLKLPFMVPAEPIARARARRLEEAGENPFEKLYLPDVVLKLRQGMGRLIRSGRDRGVVLLLDRRLTHSPYGGFVLRAITDRYVRCEHREDTVGRLERYFREP